MRRSPQSGERGGVLRSTEWTNLCPKTPEPVVRLKPSSYRPSRVELEEDVRIDATPEVLLALVVRDVEIEIKKDA